MNIFQKFLKRFRRKNKKSKIHQDYFKTAKQEATDKNEPWVEIISMDVNPDDLSEGSFDLDWNDMFIARLVKRGYRGRNDQEIIDEWFRDICTGVASGELENEMADPEKRRIIQQKRIDRDRTEHF